MLLSRVYSSPAHFHYFSSFVALLYSKLALEDELSGPRESWGYSSYSSATVKFFLCPIGKDEGVSLWLRKRSKDIAAWRDHVQTLAFFNLKKMSFASSSLSKVVQSWFLQFQNAVQTEPPLPTVFIPSLAGQRIRSGYQIAVPRIF